jgi:hypothetical protein
MRLPAIVRKLLRDDAGTILVEYVEVTVLVVIVAAIALAPLGSYLLGYYDRIEYLSQFPMP